MQHVEVMSLEEKLDICRKARELKQQGKKDESLEVMKTLPMPPYLAKWAKKRLGADFLTEGGWNLAEANIEYGTDWLTR